MHALELQSVVANDLVWEAVLLKSLPEQEDHVALVLVGTPERSRHEMRAIVNDRQQGHLAQVPEAVIALEVNLSEFIGELTLELDVTLAFPGYTPTNRVQRVNVERTVTFLMTADRRTVTIMWHFM